MSIVGAVMVPHPPLIVPEVGRGGESVIRETTDSYVKAAEFIRDLAPDTIVLSSPHSTMYADYLHISPGSHASGDLGMFGAPQVHFDADYDEELSSGICSLAEAKLIPAGYEGERDSSLDHGTMVPLYFIRQKYTDFKLVRLAISGISLEEHYRLGQIISEASDILGRRVVYVASGDLSHKLQEDGPYGFDKAGPEYDSKIMDVMGSGRFGELLKFDPVLCDDAAECGHRSFVIMAGALDGKAVETRMLSHQDVTGVGYGICTYKVSGEDSSRRFLDGLMSERVSEAAERKAGEDPFVSLARLTVETYIKRHTLPEIPVDLPQEMTDRKAGVFVTLHIGDRLRGCIGTISPVRQSIVQEIMANAISACTRDPRFNPVRPDELPLITYSVDVLGDAEDIDSEDSLDVKRYGVIVTNGDRRGLLLPDLDGVDTVAEQVAIARSKAGIAQDEPVSLQRFEVVRHY